jgi:hypothetical protein
VHIANCNDSRSFLLSKLSACRGYERGDVMSHCYQASDLFDQSVSLNCLFRIHNDGGQNVTAPVLETIQSSISSFPKSINVCVHQKCGPRKPGRLPQFVGESSLIEFGNLATPFEFYSAFLYQGQKKFKVILDFDWKVAKFLYFNEQNKLCKFEFSFDSIDPVICIDLNESSGKYVDVYISLKQPPFYFTHPKDMVKPEQLHRSFIEEDLDWSRLRQGLSNAANLTLKIRFEKKNQPTAGEESVRVISSLSNINDKYVLFTRVTAKRVSYTLDDFTRDFREIFPDFEFQYLIQAFISQCDFILTGKVTRRFLDLLMEVSENCCKLLGKLSRIMI